MNNCKLKAYSPRNSFAKNLKAYRLCQVNLTVKNLRLLRFVLPEMKRTKQKNRVAANVEHVYVVLVFEIPKPNKLVDDD
jgi:hypothetical protein